MGRVLYISLTELVDTVPEQRSKVGTNTGSPDSQTLPTVSPIGETGGYSRSKLQQSANLRGVCPHAYKMAALFQLS